MWSHDDLPTLWSNEHYTREQIREGLRTHELRGEYSQLFSQFGSERYDYERTPINETGMRLMLSPWLLNLERMSARKRADFDLPKPRITIFGEINTAGNLSVFWEPTSYGEDHGTDFVKIPHPGSNQWGARPSRELLFFRGVLEPLNSLTATVNTSPVEANLPGLYITEINRELRRLKDRLDWHFEITWKIHVTIRETELPDGKRFVSEAYIETTDEKAIREIAEQRAAVHTKMEAFEETYGFTLDHYFEVRQAAPTETKIGKPMTDMGRNRHVGNLLRAQGFVIDGTTVNSIETLLDELEAVSNQS